MTRTANARIAGFTYLFYAAIGICLELLMHRARSVDGDSAAKLGFPTGPLAGYYQWLPALVFQVVLALWLLIKGVATPARLSVPSQDV